MHKPHGAFYLERMNMTYLRCAAATLGIFASTIAIEGQGGGGGGGGAGGGGAGGGAAGGAAAGTAAGGVAGGGRAAPATAARSGTIGARGGSTIGGGNIISPSATPPIGGANIITTPQNTIGGSPSGNTFISPPSTLPPTATLPGGGVAANQQALAVTSLPAPVQTALRNVTTAGQVGSVSQIQGVNGPIYSAQVTENGVPVELQISQTGQIISRTPVSTSMANTAAGNLANTQAGLPLSSLPAPVQSSIQSQLGANGQVQTISRDDLANGTVFRVTSMQNGVPTESRFGANGTFLGSTALNNGALTSPFVPTAAGVLPGSAVVLSDLPTAAQSAIRDQLGTGHAPTQLTQIQGTNGLMYAVSYDRNGRPMVMTVGPDGRIISNNPITSVGSAATRTSGSGAGTNAPAGHTNASNRTSLNLKDLPDAVQQTLKEQARYAEIRSITREQRVGGDVYTVAVRGDNNVGDLVINADGKVLSDNRRNYAELSVPKVTVDDEQVTGIPFNTTPLAIQNAVKAYATASDIRSIALTNDRDGKPVYDVVFYRDGQRDQMFVLKDGTVRRVERNVSPAVELPNPNKASVIAIGDLPQPVRDTIRRQTEGVMVKDIKSKQLDGNTVYQVHYQTNGAPVELLVGTDGRVVLPEGSLARESAGAPLQAPIRRDELSSAKVVNANDNVVASVNSGRAATSERATVRSSASEVATNSSGAIEHPATKVNISDVPAPVQNAAKKLAGTATIDSITPKLSDAGVTYEIAFMQNGARRSVMVNKDGVVINE
jgi:hypothetical protein